MAKIKRESVMTAPLVGGVIGIFTFFILYYLADLRNMAGDILGLQMGLFLSLVLSVVVAAILFGELLADALEGK